MHIIAPVQYHKNVRFDNKGGITICGVVSRVDV